MEIKSYLPIFNGFYNTIFDASDEMIEENIEYHNEENDTDLNYDDFKWDFKEYHNRIAKACISPIWNELNHLFSNIKSPEINIEFEQLVSPKFYNYSTDSIDVTYKLDWFTFAKIVGYLNENRSDFEQYLIDRYTSRSGFSSFYSNDSEVWFNEYLKQDSDKLEHCFGSILEFVLQRILAHSVVDGD